MKLIKNNFLYLLFLIIITPLLVKGGVGGGFSKGDAYFSKLQNWYQLAKSNNWSTADQLEKQLDPADVVAYKLTHYPPELKKFVNNLAVKPNKSVEDWLELARIDSILGKDQDSLTAITQAKTLDPIRDDITQIYYQSVK